MRAANDTNIELNLLPAEELTLRLSAIQQLMLREQADGMLIADNANLYYLTGRVFAGYVYVPAAGMPVYFVKRPVHLTGNNVLSIHKPEDIPSILPLESPQTLALELDTMAYSTIERLQKLFPEAKTRNASAILRQARAVKTPLEIEKIAQSGVKQERVYRKVPQLYTEGMTDLELQVEIERTSRLEGCLGQFRISGNSMELYMGSILAGDNADSPSPYDFAMGGEGLDPSLPVGCNGTLIRRGESVMVDVNGNYTGYMTDMTRTFAVSPLEPLAEKAHQCSINICHTLQQMMHPGVEARILYDTAKQMAEDAGLGDYFMGHRQKAGFVGHGVGIEINELPVIAPRSRDLLQAGNVIALEPKFVIPGVGAVGIENTYVVGADNSPGRCLTLAQEQILLFD